MPVTIKQGFTMVNKIKLYLWIGCKALEWNKIENGLLGYFWQILEMLLEPVLALGGWGVPEFLQPGPKKRLIKG